MEIIDGYISLPLNVDTQDVYIVRTAIREVLGRQLPKFSGTFLLDIGCGAQDSIRGMILSPPSRVEKYLGMDLSAAAGGVAWRPDQDVEWNGVSMPLDACSVDCAMATEVLEHCPDPSAILREGAPCDPPRRYPLLTVPFLWPLHTPPYDVEYGYARGLHSKDC